MDRNEVRRNAAIGGLLAIIEEIEDGHLMLLEQAALAEERLREEDKSLRNLRMALASLGHDLGIPCEWDQATHPACLCAADSRSEGYCKAPVPLPEDWVVICDGCNAHEPFEHRCHQAGSRRGNIVVHGKLVTGPCSCNE